MPSLVPAPRVRVVVWRHGETTHNASGRWQGQLDTELSDTGRAQAAEAAPLLAEMQPAVVVSSDLARAASTADVLGGLLGIDVPRDERLREIHAGDWQGKSADEVRAEYPEDAERLLTGEDFRRGGHGETVAEVAARARAACDEAVARLDEAGGGVVVLATHGVAARALAADLVGLDQSLAWRTIGGLGNCRWGEVVRTRSGAWRLEAWNAGLLSTRPHSIA